KVKESRLPFPDGSFDRVAVVDMLEHVVDEHALARELARITRPGGRLVVNTPHLKRTLLRRARHPIGHSDRKHRTRPPPNTPPLQRTLLRPARHAIGQTDENHGPLRPGYTPQRLRELFPEFTLEGHRTYSRFFSEVVDTGINWGVER